jgi:hypothetical protein
MKYLKRFCIVTVVSMAILSISSQELQAAEKFKVKKGEKEWLIFREQDEGWKAEAPGLTVRIKEEGNKLEFKTSSAEYVMKEKEEGKFKIYNPDGSLLLKVKCDGEKCKIYQSEEDPDPWEIKVKDENRFKVEKGDKELGQVKFYPDTLKVKVKDPSNAELCSMKSDRLRSAPAVCLFNELPEEQKLILFALFMIID